MLRDELLRSKNDEIAYVLILLDSTLFSLSNDTFFLPIFMHWLLTENYFKTLFVVAEAQIE